MTTTGVTTGGLAMNQQEAAGAPGQTVLAAAQAGRFVIQDYCPLADSIEWHLGQRYWRQRGNKAFIADATPVPFLINNDGTLSRDAAQVFFTSLVAAEEAAGSGDPRRAEGRAGGLEPEIFVLELGIGVGLFARYFLDAMRDLCSRHNKDYYRRLYYVAADRSEQMLQDACRHGVFANHPGRYLLRVVDALTPDRDLLGDVAFHRGEAGSGDVSGAWSGDVSGAWSGDQRPARSRTGPCHGLEGTPGRLA